MLTQQQISRKAAEEYRNRTAEEENAFAYGATWASAQCATEMARLEGEKAELLRLLNAIHAIASELWVGMHQLNETQKIEMENASKYKK